MVVRDPLKDPTQAELDALLLNPSLQQALKEAKKAQMVDDIPINPQLLAKNPQISTETSRIEVESEEEEDEGYAFEHEDSQSETTETEMSDDDSMNMDFIPFIEEQNICNQHLFWQQDIQDLMFRP